MKYLPFIVLTAWLASSCGVVGAPVAPETIGVAPVIERQKLQQEAAGSRQPPAPETDDVDLAPQGQDEELPPLRPIGTR